MGGLGRKFPAPRSLLPLRRVVGRLEVTYRVGARDFETEFQMAGRNARLDPEIETVFYVLTRISHTGVVFGRQSPRRSGKRSTTRRL
jgi:hypothetical protein